MNSPGPNRKFLKPQKEHLATIEKIWCHCLGSQIHTQSCEIKTSLIHQTNHRIEQNGFGNSLSYFRVKRKNFNEIRFGFLHFRKGLSEGNFCVGFQKNQFQMIAKSFNVHTATDQIGDN